MWASGGCRNVRYAIPSPPFDSGNRIRTLVNPDKLRRILAYVLSENEFLSPYGIRSLSCYHAEHPYVFNAGA